MPGPGAASRAQGPGAAGPALLRPWRPRSSGLGSPFWQAGLPGLPALLPGLSCSAFLPSRNFDSLRKENVYENNQLVSPALPASRSRAVEGASSSTWRLCPARDPAPRSPSGRMGCWTPLLLGSARVLGGPSPARPSLSARVPDPLLLSLPGPVRPSHCCRGQSPPRPLTSEPPAGPEHLPSCVVGARSPLRRRVNRGPGRTQAELEPWGLPVGFLLLAPG